MSEDKPAIVHASASFGRVVLGLPPGFLVLAVLNIVLVGMVMWFLDSQLDTRLALLTKILDRCLH